MLAPPRNCFSMSAVSSKEPYLSVESVYRAEDDEGQGQKHGGCGGRRGIVQLQHPVININGESPRDAGNVSADHQDNTELSEGMSEAKDQASQYAGPG